MHDGRIRTKHDGCRRLNDAVATWCGWVAHLLLQCSGRSLEQQTLDLTDSLLDLWNLNRINDDSR